MSIKKNNIISISKLKCIYLNDFDELYKFKKIEKLN